MMPDTHHTELLPWHRETYQHLCQLNTEQKLGHAYLFGGQQGLGKLSLARYVAHYLLCKSPVNMQPCNECHSCHLINSDTHPDLKLLMPEEKSRYIKIEQVRATLEFMANTSLIGGRKIMIISPAENLNINAANALLKLLEEPAAGSLLILVSHQPTLLMATIRSRCQILNFSCPAFAMASSWLQSKNITGSAEILLKLANGAPLRALHLADEDALHERSILHLALAELLSGEITLTEAVQKCSNFSIEDNIEGMMLCIADILEYQQCKQFSKQQGEINDPELRVLAKSLSGKMKIQGLHRSYQELIAARLALASSTNPNPQLILESLFYQWSQLKYEPQAQSEIGL